MFRVIAWHLFDFNAIDRFPITVATEDVDFVCKADTGMLEPLHIHSTHGKPWLICLRVIKLGEGMAFTAGDKQVSAAELTH